MTNQELLIVRQGLTDKVNKFRRIVDRIKMKDVDKQAIVNIMTDINKLVAEIDEVDDIFKRQSGK